MRRNVVSRCAPGVAAMAAGFALLMFTGCERKERVLDVKTPGVDVKVDRNIDTGNVEVKTERK